MTQNKDQIARPVKIHQPDAYKSKQFTPRSHIYVRAVQGFYQALRRRMGLFFMAVFLLLPWLQYNGKQAILLDVENQLFSIFSLSLWPQDFTLFVWILVIAAFALFIVTTFIGRVWCGYMCPQTVWTFIFIWFEEKIEGTRNQRMKLDKQVNSFNKLWRKTAKHLCWFAFSLFTSLSFIGYFTAIDQLFIDFFTFNATFLYVAWILFFTVCTYGNAGWMREIMCTHICPYARFQAAMFDKDTFTVSYNPTRGESRGPRSRKQDHKAMGLGDCIDCNLCVQVCPTGIDIRNGLQYECINCGACIDACDGVMEKMKYDKGLISYTTEHALSGKKTQLIRSKLIGYAIILSLMTGLFVHELATRIPMELDIIRDRGKLYRETYKGEFENTYTLKILNKSQLSGIFNIKVEGIEEFQWLGDNNIKLDGGGSATKPISLVVDPYLLDSPMTEFNFVITVIYENGERQELSQESRFFKR